MLADARGLRSLHAWCIGATVAPRMAYRRGTVALQTIEARVSQGLQTADDQRALMAMRQAQASHINSRTVSAIGGICGESDSDPYAAAAMPRDIAQAFLRKVFVLFLLQQILSLGLVLGMCLDESPVQPTFENLFRPISAQALVEAADLKTMPIPKMLTKYNASWGLRTYQPCKNLSVNSIAANSTAIVAACNALRDDLIRISSTTRQGASATAVVV